jgi:hypothetical protein
MREYKNDLLHGDRIATEFQGGRLIYICVCVCVCVYVCMYVCMYIFKVLEVMIMRKRE